MRHRPVGQQLPVQPRALPICLHQTVLMNIYTLYILSICNQEGCSVSPPSGSSTSQLSIPPSPTPTRATGSSTTESTISLHLHPAIQAGQIGFTSPKDRTSPNISGFITSTIRRPSPSSISTMLESAHPIQGIASKMMAFSKLSGKGCWKDIVWRS